ncbi:division/cell wall cluster transcriptional repressor MraZ [Petrocella atlantisensis]|nr:division/cell wall cluster transcriptional repressor MraZ [Petrocella atlantisensis]
MMFIGEYNHSIDEKGRVRIPKNFRDELGETFYLTKGFDKCLFVFSEDQWHAFQSKLGENQLKSKDFRKIHRFFTGSAMACVLDGQGRAMVSPSLRTFGELDKEVVVIGVGSRIEIWSKEIWDKYKDDELDDVSDLADSLEGLNL